MVVYIIICDNIHVVINRGASDVLINQNFTSWFGLNFLAMRLACSDHQRGLYSIAEYEINEFKMAYVKQGGVYCSAFGCMNRKTTTAVCI